ncbi:hypothetical protein IPM65_03260 [Candidatus Roizmanbacteria bacterium]|nr:MAG: hypothetical protein IPM65_03260 [Candidatus Roizmanbacteria bacterium]
MSQSAIASFSFEPVNISASAGDIIPVDVMIYSGADPVISTDIYISYDPSILSIASPQNPELKKGELFQSVDAKVIQPGSLYIYAINPSADLKQVTNGKIATIYFQAQKEGSTELRFDCVPFMSQTSQIIRNDEELSNIINCTSTRSHSTSVVINDRQEVLGVSVGNGVQPTWGYVIVSLLMIILTAVLFMRYRKLMTKLKTK